MTNTQLVDTFNLTALSMIAAGDVTVEQIDTLRPQFVADLRTADRPRDTTAVRAYIEFCTTVF